jgi:hypothetical protein
MAEVASVLETPWNMSTSADLAFPRRAANGRRISRKLDSSKLPLFRAAVADPVVHRATIEVAQLLQPRSLLQESDIMRRIEAEPAKAAA